MNPVRTFKLIRTDTPSNKNDVCRREGGLTG